MSQVLRFFHPNSLYFPISMGRSFWRLLGAFCKDLEDQNYVYERSKHSKIGGPIHLTE